MPIEEKTLGAMLTALIREAYDGPDDPRMTWFADNENGSGLLGTLERLSAAEASASPPGAASSAGPGGASVAAHAGHVAFALNLANRALRGESVHAGADWKSSWNRRTVDEAGWRALLVELRTEYASLLEAIDEGLPWTDPMNMTGIFGQLAHGAWHLGAIRQLLGLVTPA